MKKDPLAARSEPWLDEHSESCQGGTLAVLGWWPPCDSWKTSAAFRLGSPWSQPPQGLSPETQGLTTNPGIPTEPLATYQVICDLVSLQPSGSGMVGMIDLDFRLANRDSETLSHLPEVTQPMDDPARAEGQVCLTFKSLWSFTNTVG